MRLKRVLWLYVVAGLILLSLPRTSKAQLNSGTIIGTIMDPSGAAVPGAKVRILNPVSSFASEATSGPDGTFRIANVPFASYHMTVSVPGFDTFTQDMNVQQMIPVSLQIALKLASGATTVTVQSEAADLIQLEPSVDTAVSRAVIQDLPLPVTSTALSSLITMSAPGVVADSNGMFHALGEHSEVAYSLDGQPITDQQSKIFSNQIPADAIQSFDVQTGIPKAEFGDKTSLVARVVTRSGLNQTRPTGDITTSYGSFGTATGAFDIGYGGNKFGNFLAASGLDTQRYLDPPEFAILHDSGNSQNIFDRFDIQANSTDSIHLDILYMRSSFQTPNDYDQQSNAGVINLAGNPVGPQNQSSLINSFDIAPNWTHLFSANVLLSVNAYVRQDRFGYFPSNDVFADQPATFGQTRHLTNSGIHAEVSYVKGIHNIKAGVEFNDWLLLEQDRFGVTSPTYNSPCLAASANPVPGFTAPSQCAGSGFFPNIASNPNAGSIVPLFLPGLLPFDLTRAGALLNFNGSTNIKEPAIYAQDTITLGHWNFDVGLRGDFYRGLSSGSMAEPRLAAAYNLRKTNTVFRLGYAREMETPYNENLLLSSSTSVGGLGSAAGIGAFGQSPLIPASRNQYDAGFEQAFGKYLVVDAEYFWKYTDHDFDFDIFFNTPLAFPIQWAKSKIDGATVRVSVPNFHGFTAYDVLGTARARFFPPETGGLIFNSPINTSVFRIDHDEALESTFHMQYQPKATLPWIGFNWRYDSGLVAGAVPCAGAGCPGWNPTLPGTVNLTGLTGDQQLQAGLFCGSQVPTLTTPLTTCPASLYGSTRLTIPAPGTYNPDHNPQRVAPRNLLDVAVGDDNLFHGDRYKWSLQLTVVNLTDAAVLYNFLSTFSGTHFVTPRAETVQLGFHF